MNSNDMKEIMKIYSSDEYEYQEKRYSKLVERYKNHFTDADSSASDFSDSELCLFSSPGRTELGGNHTDHNHGKVLAAAVNLDTIAAAQVSGNSIVTIYSEGYAPLSIDICRTEIIKEEEGSTEALVRGIAAAFRSKGLKAEGFNAVVSSDVPPGSGLSSSASIEMLITYIFNYFFNSSSVSIPDCARMSKYAENVYFNKPSGLMDQTACGYGGIISIDFKNEGDEIIDPVNFSFADHGYVLTVVKTDSDHADLTDDYSGITDDMRNAASFFGKKVLREVDEAEFYRKIPQVRKAAGGRAVIRAAHFFNENKKVDLMIDELKNNGMEDYLDTVKESGNSSYKYLQNVYSVSACQDQATSIALMMTENFLSNNSAKIDCSNKECGENTVSGACRIHGGGFAGTIQAYIPSELFNSYKTYIENVFGKGSAVPLKIRNKPGGFTCTVQL